MKLSNTELKDVGSETTCNYPVLLAGLLNLAYGIEYYRSVMHKIVI